MNDCTVKPTFVPMVEVNRSRHIGQQISVVRVRALIVMSELLFSNNAISTNRINMLEEEVVPSRTDLVNLVTI